MLLHNMYKFAIACIYCVYCDVLCFPHVHLSRHMTKAHDRGTWQRHMTSTHSLTASYTKWHGQPLFFFHNMAEKDNNDAMVMSDRGTKLRWDLAKAVTWLWSRPLGRAWQSNEAWTLWRFGKGIQTMCCTQCPGGVMAEVGLAGTSSLRWVMSNDDKCWRQMLTKVRKSPKSIPKRPSDRICGDWEVNVVADLAKSCSQICYNQMLKCIQYTDIIHILGDGHQSIKWDLYPHHKASVVRLMTTTYFWYIYILYILLRTYVVRTIF